MTTSIAMQRAPPPPSLPGAKLFGAEHSHYAQPVLQCAGDKLVNPRRVRHRSRFAQQKGWKLCCLQVHCMSTSVPMVASLSGLLRCVFFRTVHRHFNHVRTPAFVRNVDPVQISFAVVGLKPLLCAHIHNSFGLLHSELLYVIYFFLCMVSRTDRRSNKTGLHSGMAELCLLQCTRGRTKTAHVLGMVFFLFLWRIMGLQGAGRAPGIFF